jgi:hypothetical protein
VVQSQADGAETSTTHLGVDVIVLETLEELRGEVDTRVRTREPAGVRP